MKKYIKESMEWLADEWMNCCYLWDDKRLRNIIKAKNIRVKSDYLPEYFGVLQSFDMVFFNHHIKTIKYPNSIIDAIKLKFFPNFLLKRFPAKIKVFDIRAYLPRLKYTWDKMGELKKDIDKIPEDEKLIVIAQKSEIEKIRETNKD